MFPSFFDFWFCRSSLQHLIFERSVNIQLSRRFSCLLRDCAPIFVQVEGKTPPLLSIQSKLQYVIIEDNKKKMMRKHRQALLFFALL